MQKKQFELAVQNIIEKDPRFEAEAYDLLKDVLDYSAEELSEQRGRNEKHVTAEELLFSFRDYTLEQYGPMASTLLDEWGLKTCSDVGDMVFLLIDEGVFAKSDSDDREDFADVYDFYDVFVAPYLPEKKLKRVGK